MFDFGIKDTAKLGDHWVVQFHTGPCIGYRKRMGGCVPAYVNGRRWNSADTVFLVHAADMGLALESVCQVFEMEHLDRIRTKARERQARLRLLGANASNLPCY